jgi:hypothetical protein
MKIFSDKTQRKINVLIEPHDINRFIYELLNKQGYAFEEKETELKYSFVEEGSPAYKTGKIQCHAIITKDIT